MWRFCPYNTFEGAIPKDSFFAHELHTIKDKFLKIDLGVPCVKSLFMQTSADIPTFSIVIEEKGRIDPIRSLKPIRFTPWTLRLGRRYNKVS